MPSDEGLRLIDALEELARELLTELDADACVVSRVLGDVLVIVTHASNDDAVLNLGQGFLVSDFPPTKAVIDSGDPAVLTLDDPGVDSAEAGLLIELGYATLLMTPLRVRDEQWGLVEVYRRDARPFGAAEVETATRRARIG